MNFQHGTIEVLSTNLKFKNENDASIYVDKVKMAVVDFGKFQKPDQINWSRKVCPNQFILKDLEKSDEVVFFGKSGLVMKSGEEIEVQVRIIHKGYPETTVKGDLIIEYHDYYGNVGVLTLKGISVDIEN